MQQVAQSSRYFYFDLPAECAKRFQKETGSGINSLDEVGLALRTTILPVMIDLLTARKEAIATAYQSEADRQKFIVTKANELGISAEMLEKVYSHCLIGVLIVTDYQTGSSSRNAALAGGIAWYQLATDNDTITCQFAGTSEANSGTFNRIVKIDLPFGKKKTTYDDAFRSFVANLEVATRQNEAFRMETQILSAAGNTLFLSVGRADGLSIDDKYYIVEDVVTADTGIAEARRRGWARVTKLYRPDDPGPARSRAKVVNGTGISPGMRLTEIPTRRWELEIGLAYIPYRISGGRVSSPTSTLMEITGDRDRTAAVAQLGLNYDVGAVLNDPLLFVGARVAFGFTKFGATFQDDQFAESHTMVFAADVSWAQRFYIGQIGLDIGGKYGGILLWNNFEDSEGVSGIRQSSIRGSSSGFSVEGGIDLWLHPHLTIRMLTERRFYGRSHWSAEVNDRHQTIVSDDLPTLDFSPISFRVSFTWNLGSM